MSENEPFFPQKGAAEVNENVFEVYCSKDATLLYIIYGCVRVSSMLVVALTTEMVNCNFGKDYWDLREGSK